MIDRLISVLIVFGTVSNILSIMHFKNAIKIVRIYVNDNFNDAWPKRLISVNCLKNNIFVQQKDSKNIQ